jgi:hypothetical protein
VVGDHGIEAAVIEGQALDVGGSVGEVPAMVGKGGAGVPHHARREVRQHDAAAGR